MLAAGNPFASGAGNRYLVPVAVDYSRFAEALRSLGVTGEVRELPAPAPTAGAAAAQLGCEVGAIANSLVFAADGAPLLVMTSGAHRVDTARIAKVLQVSSVERAVGGAYDAFVGTGKYTVTGGEDVTVHGDIVTFSAHLTEPSGEAAWTARIFLLLDGNGQIREDYHVVVKPLPAT